MNNYSQNPTPPFPSPPGNASALPLPDWVHNGTALPFRPLEGNSSRYNNMGDINPEELNVFVVSMLCTMFLCNCAFVFTVLRRRWGLLENEFAEGDDSAGGGSGSAVYQGVSSLIMKKLPVYMYPPPPDKVLLAGQTACCVCIDEYEIGDEVRILPCDHIFHVPCVDEWLQRSRCCPMCKQIVVPVVPAPRQGWGSGGRADRVDGGDGGGGVGGPARAQGGGAGAARGRIENAHGSYANSGSELETAEQKVGGGEETVARDVGVVGLGDIPSSRRSGRGGSRSGVRRFFQRFQRSTNVVPSPPSPGRIRRIEVGSAAGTLGGSVGTVGALDTDSNVDDTHGEDWQPERFSNDHTHEQKHHDPVHAGGLRVTRGAGGAPRPARAHSTGASRHRVHPEVGGGAGEDGTTRTVQSNYSSPVSTEVAVATIPGADSSGGEIDFS